MPKCRHPLGHNRSAPTGIPMPPKVVLPPPHDFFGQWFKEPYEKLQERRIKQFPHAIPDNPFVFALLSRG